MAKKTPKKPSKTRTPTPAVRKKSAAPKAGKNAKNAKKTTKGKAKPTSKAPAKRAAAVAKKAPPKFAAAKKPTPPAAPMAKGPPVVRPPKNLAGLKARDLEFFRNLLVAKRRELLGDVHAMEQEALRTSGGTNLSNLPIHMADMGTDNYEQEFTLGLVEKDRELLREINMALGKIRDGSYGICEGTGKPIVRARLEAKPWARYSIDYTRQVEKGLVRR